MILEVLNPLGNNIFRFLFLAFVLATEFSRLLKKAIFWKNIDSFDFAHLINQMVTHASVSASPENRTF